MTETNYAERCGDKEIAIHCDPVIAERIYEGICKIFAEYRRECTDQERIEKRSLAKLKSEIEPLLPKINNHG